MRESYITRFDTALRKVDSYDFYTRIDGIEAIAKQQDQNAARLLLTLYDQSVWRDGKRYILFKLTNFLHFDRVFFKLADSLYQIDDLQLSNWIISVFKYSKTNRYDRFLANYYQYASSEILKEKTLDTLIYLQSSEAERIIDVKMNAFGLHLAELKDGVLEKSQLHCLQALPSSISIALSNFIGSFRWRSLKGVLEVLTKNSDYFVADSAYFNLLRLGESVTSVEDAYELSLMQMESKDPIKEEMQAVFYENYALQKVLSIENQLDVLLGKEERLVSNREILLLSNFPTAVLKEYISICDFTKQENLFYRIFELMHFDKPYLIEQVKQFVKEKPSASRCGRAFNLLWKKESEDVVVLFEDMFATYRKGLPLSAENSRGETIFSSLELVCGCQPLINNWLEKFENSVFDDREKIEVINLLVMEYHLDRFGGATRKAVELFMDCVLSSEIKTAAESKLIVLRIYRAFGQMGQRSRKYFQNFQNFFYLEGLSEVEKNGLLKSLVMNPTIQSHKLSISIFNEYLLGKDKKRKAELTGDTRKTFLEIYAHEKYALPEALYLTILDMTGDLSIIHSLRFIFFRPDTIALPWLQKLRNKESALSYHEKKWIVRIYAKLNDDTAIKFLETIALGEEDTLRELALYSLTKFRSNLAIKTLLNIAEVYIKSDQKKARLPRLFQRLSVPQGNVEVIIKQLEVFLVKIDDAELADSIISYIARLAVKYPLKEMDVRSNLDNVMTKLIETSLRQKIAGFDQLGLLVRSVLFNAEIPAAYPDIFHDQVDKSTSILQYIKAIDILLKELVGDRIANQSMLTRMQNIIIGSGLDRLIQHSRSSYYSRIGEEVNILKILEIEHGFTVQQLPIGKLKATVESILTGVIFREEFRVIDGLKSWGILLLLFARSWGRQLETKLIVPQDGVATIVGVAKRLIELQDYRNPIAHRHTILELLPVEKVKQRTYKLMNDLIAMFDQKGL